MSKKIAVALFVLFLAITTAAFAATINLPKTGQAKCYSSTTLSEIPCAGTGQDGEIQAGVAWPSPRFTDNGDGTVTDNLTGLMWLKDGNCFGGQTWLDNALEKVADFNTSPRKYPCQDYTATYNDWRLPNVRELESLSGKGTYYLNSQGFLNIKESGYWSSTWVEGYGPTFIKMDGTVYNYDGGVDVLPVRGTTTLPAQIPKTGQTKCYTHTSFFSIPCAGTGQDGEIQAGVAWPSPRFTDNGDGTVTDNLTGLMWLKDGNCLIGGLWDNSLFYIADFNTNHSRYNCVNYTASYTDWRLPNRKELLSLIDYSQPGLPADHPFVNIQGNYWSSTPSGCSYTYCSAWWVSMGGTTWSHSTNTGYYSAWAVRGGQSGLFSDVLSDYWAYNYIIAIYNAGITVGCSQNPLSYCPEDNVTRGQMAAFIIRSLYGESFSYTTTPYFTDVPLTNVFFKYVQKLKDEGITAVTGTYGVDNEVTRGQMAAFIIRSKYGESFTYTQTPYFSDVPALHGFFKYVQKLKDEGITAVTGIYGVDNIVSRDQMAAFLSRAFLGMQ